MTYVKRWWVPKNEVGYPEAPAGEEHPVLRAMVLASDYDAVVAERSALENERDALKARLELYESGTFPTVKP